MKKVIDLRSPFEYQKGHLEGAILMSYEELRIQPEKYLKKENQYGIYCSSGRRSKILSSYLNQLGYDTINLGSYALIQKEH